MISRALALRLRDAGLVWHPASGDAFQLRTQDMEGTGTEVFIVSDMTIEAHHFPTGTVLGFNGTTEWALDSVAIGDAVWMPREDQLRAALKDTFVRLERRPVPPEWRVVTVFLGDERAYDGDDAAEAYGSAVLAEVLAAR